MPGPPLDFNNCLWGWYPYIAGKPAVHPFDTNVWVGYGKSVLRCKTGWWWLPKNDVFDGALYDAVRAMQQWFGLPIDGHIGTDDWAVLDFLATH